MAGIVKPKNLDGDTLWPTLTGKEKLVQRKPMVWVFPEYGGQVAVTRQKGMMWPGVTR